MQHVSKEGAHYCFFIGLNSDLEMTSAKKTHLTHFVEKHVHVRNFPKTVNQKVIAGNEN